MSFFSPFLPTYFFLNLFCGHLLFCRFTLFFQVSKDIAKKIAFIQNPGLGEFRIRDLNDEINKLLRVKQAWEYRIRELGGIDYRLGKPKKNFSLFYFL